MRPKNFHKYLIMIGIRSLEYGYSDEQLFQHVNYFRKCHKQHLSAYKALLFLQSHIEELKLKENDKK